MKVLRILLYILLGIVALFVILALIGPKESTIERSITIEAPKEIVWEHVNSLQDMEEWNPWIERDTAMEASYTGEEGDVGSKYSWKSDSINVGTGTQTITKVSPTDTIVTELMFEGMGTSDAWVRLESVSTDQTKVYWGLHSEFGFTSRPFMLFIDLEDAVGKDYDKGLQYLKEWVESGDMQDMGEYEVKEIKIQQQKYMVQSDTVKFQDMSEQFSNVGTAIHMAMEKGDLSATGTLVGLYYSWDTVSMSSHMAIGVPTDMDEPISGFELITLEAQPGVQVDYYGPYDQSGKAHDYLAMYAEKMGIELKAPAIERYVTDPSVEPDTAKWLTEVIYPVQK